jgi:transposase
MTATHQRHCTSTKRVLYLAFELGWTGWKLAFKAERGQPPRLRSIGARDLGALHKEIAKAKQRFGLAEDTPVVSCYEAGRDGFWLTRYLATQNIDNLVVDSSSIEVNRRQRRAKTDRLDAVKLVQLLVRHHEGEKVWGVVRVPGVADEDRRQLHRELEALKDERTEHVNRIKGLLASQGVAAEVDGKFAELLVRVRMWDGQPLGSELQARLLREWERWWFLERQIQGLENERRKRIRRDETPRVEQVRHLLQLAGIGLNGSWLLVYELFGWRQIRNRRELAGLLGLTPTPFQSGPTAREQGISKAGNRRLRRLLVELAWGWLRFQPDSALSQWYARRFGQGNRRLRKIGIVALARKLAIALWRYLETGEVPAGAAEVDWRPKVNGLARKKAG